MNKKRSIIMVIFILLTALSINAEKKKNYLEDAKMYFNYGEYEKAIENSKILYKTTDNKKEKEEALYLINESAEEIVDQLKKKLYIDSDDAIKQTIKKYDKKYDINIVPDKIGYEYLLYYDKAYYEKLKDLNPKSEFIQAIELRHLVRMSKFVTDYIQRYKDVINVIEKYWKVYKRNPKAEYAPQLLLKIADLNLYLGEEGENIKSELNISDNKIAEYFQNAKEIYKKVKKEYPDSTAARSIAYVIDNVKIRLEPKTKSKVIKQIPQGTMVKIIDRSEKMEAISNMYAYWFKIKLVTGLEGWIYGFYLRTSE